MQIDRGLQVMKYLDRNRSCQSSSCDVANAHRPTIMLVSDVLPCYRIESDGSPAVATGHMAKGLRFRSMVACGAAFHKHSCSHTLGSAHHIIHNARTTVERTRSAVERARTTSQARKQTHLRRFRRLHRRRRETRATQTAVKRQDTQHHAAHAARRALSNRRQYHKR
jgi:hypothetical protein